MDPVSTSHLKERHVVKESINSIMLTSSRCFIKKKLLKGDLTASSCTVGCIRMSELCISVGLHQKRVAPTHRCTGMDEGIREAGEGERKE